MQAVADALRRTGFAERIEYRRRRARSAYEPFCPRTGESLPGADEADRLVGLLHDGTPLPTGFDQRLARALVAGGLAADDLGGGHWELTAYRGLLAARDRAGAPGGGRVYIGEDSLRFVETILDTAPRGLALDIGGGSGITACALARSARRVISVDVEPEAVRATTISAVLNGVADRVSPTLGRFEDVAVPGRLNCIAANLPYVPVPAGLSYSPAGNGGPDGLSLIRTLLGLAGELLDPADGTLVMRFQSLGDECGPLLVDDLRRFAARTGYDVVVTVDGRVPYEVRAALTALLAGRHNPGYDDVRLFDVLRLHLRGYGLPQFLACALVARAGGSGRVDVVQLCPPSALDVRLAPVGRATDLPSMRKRIAAGYWHASRDLPDGFRELGAQCHVEAPVERLGEVVHAMAGGATVRGAADRVFADLVAAEPLRARSLLVTVDLLAHQLLDTRSMRPR